MVLSWGQRPLVFPQYAVVIAKQIKSIKIKSRHHVKSDSVVTGAQKKKLPRVIDVGGWPESRLGFGGLRLRAVGD